MILCNLYNFKKKALAAAGDNIFLKKYSEAFCHELNIPPKTYYVAATSYKFEIIFEILNHLNSVKKLT